MGVWMKKFVAVAPPSAISVFVCGMGVLPRVGKELPSIWKGRGVMTIMR
jgi:hypothetical protein